MDLNQNYTTPTRATRYLTKKRKAGIKLIAEYSGDLGQKRSRVGSDFPSSLSRMIRSSYTPLNFPGPKVSCKTLNQTNLDNGSVDKRLTILVKCTHLPSIPCSRYSEFQLN